jgi:hypothetical protein
LAGQHGLVPVTCALHPDEHGFAFVADNPYAALTDNDGEFRLDQLPAGSYQVAAWYPPLVAGGQPLTAQASVTIPADGAATVTLSFPLTP